MPAILLRNMPDHIHIRLKQRARKTRRSLSAEVIKILEEALAERAGPPSLEAIDKIRVPTMAPLTDELLEEARREGRP